jgi:hypothetical protein
MRRLLGIILLALCVTAGLEASTSTRTNIRLAPADVWCPTGLTFQEARPGYRSSTFGVFDRGDLETSFRAPVNGWVYVTLTTNTDIVIDNVMAVPRDNLFPPSSGYFDSDACHDGADPDYPKVRVHPFDTASPPGGVWLQGFAVTDPGELEESGWELGDAVLDTSAGAVELLASGNQTAITAECPSAGTAVCPNATGSLFMPAGTRVRFPMRVEAGTDFVLQLWWKGPVGARLDVRVDDFAPCPSPEPGIFIEHSSVVEVEILDAELLPGIDPELFFLLALVEDQSDTFGRVTIDGVAYDVPQIDNDDNPHWEGSARFAAADIFDPSNIQVKIEMWDNDEFENAHVDLDTDPADKDLDLTVDLCRLQVEGDLSSKLQGVLTARGDPSSGDDQGLLRFQITTPSGKPLSTDDLAVVDVDFVQAVHRNRYAVTEKPGLVMVSLANNFTTPIATEVLVELYGPGGYWVSRSFPVTLDADSLQTFYLFEDAPIFPPAPTPGVESYLGINVHVDPSGVYSGGLPPGDCRIDNDQVYEKTWKIVDTGNLLLTWVKAGRVLDLSNLVSDAQRDDVRDLGTTFIRATFPTASVTSVDAPLPVPVSPVAGVVDFIATVLDTFEIPFSSVLPFVMVWDMNNFAVLSGVDKYMGVLPYSDWYRQFEGWHNVSGNSLGEAAPHAVIFLPEVKDDADAEHVMVTLPGHELAHTYGVSADPLLKDTATCGVSIIGDPLRIGDLVCGAAGGLDEYKAADPARADGNPATGYWVELGIEDPRMAHLAGAEQCDRHCFMGHAEPDQLPDWAANGRWIDVNDWEHLVTRMARHPDPEVLFVGGMIDPADNVYLAPWYRLPAGIPDRVDGDPGGYRVRFYDANNQLLQDIGFPLLFGASDTDDTPPITFFGFTVPWVPDTARIDIDRGAHDTNIPAATIATRWVSDDPPEVEIVEPPGGIDLPSHGTLDLQWDAFDVNGDELTAVVMASLDGDHWSVVHGWVEDGGDTASIPAVMFPAGSVQVKVLVTDGIHMSESQPIEVGVTGFFEDGFESGDTSVWASDTP